MRTAFSSQPVAISFDPVQTGEPLNYFVYPYAELDGKPFDGIESSFRFEDLQSPSDRDQHPSGSR
jgi:hypothetical protein